MRNLHEENQGLKVSLQERTGDAVLRSEKFGDLTTADHEVLNEGGESRNNHRYAIVVQDLATQWIQSYPFKTKTSQETGRSLQNVLELSEKPNVIYADNFWNLANIVKNYHGIIAHRRAVDLRQMALLKERYAEFKKVLLLCCYNPAWMKNGGLFLWNATTICETFKTSWKMGKHSMKGDSENHLEDQRFRLVHGRISSFFCEGPVKAPSIW